LGICGFENEPEGRAKMKLKVKGENLSLEGVGDLG